MDVTRLIPSSTNISYGAAHGAKEAASPSDAFLALNEVPITTDPTMFNIAKGNGGSVSIAFSIIKSIVGCGILSLPWSTAIIGLIPCIILISISFLISFICWMYLVICSQHLRVYEYRDIGLKLYGMKFAAFLDIILVILSCLYCVLYAVYIGEFIANGLVEYGFNINTQLITHIPINSLMDLIQTKFFILTVMIFGVLFPLTLLPKLDSLKYTSVIGIGGTIFVVVYISYVYVFRQDQSEMQLINTHNHEPATAALYWLEAFGIFSAVFFGHFNTAPMYGELKRRSIPKMFRVTLVSFIVVTFLNIFIIVSSYGIFGVNVEQNVIESLSTNALTNHINVIAALRILMSLNMIGSYPLLFWNAKIALKGLLFYKHQLLHPISESESAPKSIWSSNAAQRFMYFLITVGIWLAAIFVDQVGIILSFIQATVGNLILFIFPSLFYYKLTKQRKWLCCFIVSFGLIAMFGGIISTVLSMFNVLS